MKKVFITVLMCAIAQNAFAATMVCWTAPFCKSTYPANSTCNTICSTNVCPTGGTVTIPTGYTGSVKRAIVTTCDDSTQTYSCSCGMSKTSTLSCASGYTGTPKYEYVNGTDRFSGCTKEGTLPPPCDGTCDNCESVPLHDVADGYQSQTSAVCNTLTCMCAKKTEYLCAAGYYGTASDYPQIDLTEGIIYSGCTKCPNSGTTSGTSDGGDGTTITDCYIPKGSKFSDSTGTWEYGDDCYYTE